MKAVVLEVKDGISAILREDGVFENVNQEWTVGETIDIGALNSSTHTGTVRSMDSARSARDRSSRRSHSRTGRRVRRRIAAAAAALVVLGGGGATYQTAVACSYVDVDVNPSIEFTLNRMNRVLSVEALNEDSVEIVEALGELSIRFDTLEEALEKTQDVLREQGYLQGSEAPILVDVSTDSEKRAEKLTGAVESAIGLAANPGEDPSENESSGGLYLTFSTIREHREARENNLSGGRYQAMKRELEANFGSEDEEAAPSEETVEDFRSRPVENLFGREDNEVNVPESAPDTPSAIPEPSETTPAAPEESGIDTPEQPNAAEPVSPDSVGEPGSAAVPGLAPNGNQPAPPSEDSGSGDAPEPPVGNPPAGVPDADGPGEPPQGEVPGGQP